MQTETYKFYHGTNAAAALAILTAGSSDLVLNEIGAFDLGKRIYDAFLARQNLSRDGDLALHALRGPGAEYSSLWVPAFRGLAGDGRSHFEYGHFFATLNITNAFRYSRNPFGSEFILAIHESLKLLAHFGDPLPQQVAIDYSDLMRRLETPSTPVVLELTGISRERLRTAKGNPEIGPELEIYRLMEQTAGVNAPVDFRISGVTNQREI